MNGNGDPLGVGGPATDLGYNEFRGVQGDIVRTVAEGRHALVLMPTGGAKSLCHQLPGLLRLGVGTVIYLLITLMKDQGDTLRQLSVYAAYLNSTISWRPGRPARPS